MRSASVKGCTKQSREVQCTVILFLLMPGPFLGPGNRGYDQCKYLKFSDGIPDGIGLVVNKYPTLEDSVLTVAKVINSFSSVIIKY